MTDRKYKSEATIRELKAKLSGLEEEHHRAKQELTSLRKNSAGLDSDYHEQEKVICLIPRTRLIINQCIQPLTRKCIVIAFVSL